MCCFAIAVNTYFPAGVVVSPEGNLSGPMLEVGCPLCCSDTRVIILANGDTGVGSVFSVLSVGECLYLFFRA